ncbi:MAG TPA: MgtC/SapB family protein [Candidatus Aminicenantes bacterium]|nr:MgtC/SapB family protein [Candidatus Aminicenantes bacterium]HRY64081.1 MgtC/SapB family protein [Candidatus Aminicenantes bacterium]HRZ70994.1 MgtC/SapB family protein [Candidatus Aminicenantes bacterium]
MEILQVLLKLILAVALGGLIGLEREASQKPAGFRTNILVCLAATMMMTLAGMLAGRGAGGADTLVRMAAGVITGIGFLGAGTIFQARGTIAGLTTASTLWVVAGLGLVIGAGYYVPAVIFAALTIVTLVVFGRIEESYLRRSQFHYHLKAKARPYILSSLRKLALHHGVRLERLTMKQEGSSYLLAFSFSASEEKEQEFNQGLLELADIEELKID